MPVLLALMLCACLMAAAAAGTGRHPWLGLVALLPLFRIIQVARPRWAMLGGGLFGATVWAYSAAFVSNGVAPTLGTVLLLTVVCAVYARLGAYLTRRFAYSPLVLGAGWMLVELALHPLGLRCGLLAGTQGNGVLVHVV
ncbi:MAG: hypothetical protein ACE5EX_09160, partial [Phycisphaerae bacterium]